MNKGKIEVLRQNDKGAWSAKVVEGDTETWYGLGFNTPSVSQGDMIEFEYKKNGKFFNIDSKSIKVVDNQVESNKPVADVAKSAGGASSKEEYWSNKEKAEEFKQKQINWQSARNAAIQLVPSLLEQGVVKLPTKKADQYDTVMNLVNEMSVRFYTETQDPEAMVSSEGPDDPMSFNDLEDNAFDE